MAHDDTEESVTVAEAARRLGCDEATVRALLRAGELTGHRVGKCKPGHPPPGVRVHGRSVADYKRRHAIAAAPAANDGDRPPRPPMRNASHEEVKRRFRARGIVR